MIASIFGSDNKNAPVAAEYPVGKHPKIPKKIYLFFPNSKNFFKKKQLKNSKLRRKGQEG